MYRLKEIQDSLLHLVGWEQSYNPADAIRNDMTTTESGLYFQGAHPLVTLDNVRAIMPEQFIFIYPAFNAETTYNAGSKVSYSSKVYESLKTTIGITPGTVEATTDWREYNYLSDFLERETRKGIASMVQTFIQTKQLNNETKNLLERRTFFDGAGHIKNTIDNRGKLCGYEIVAARAMGITTKIERIGLQTTGGPGIVKIYIFHSNKVEPFKTLELDVTSANGGFQWFPVDDLYLPYISSDNNAGGSWFICYNQNELPAGMEAINISKDWSRDPCMSCNVGNVQLWRELTKYLQISPFMFQSPTDFAAFPQMWNINETVYTNAVNYGINVEVSVGCDLTDFIKSQKHIFQTALQKQVAANILRTLAMNPDVRVNRNQSNASRMEILYELDGNTSGVRAGGLGYELKKAFDAISMDTAGIDRICLSCNNHGVRYRTV